MWIAAGEKRAPRTNRRLTAGKVGGCKREGGEGRGGSYFRFYSFRLDFIVLVWYLVVVCFLFLYSVLCDGKEREIYLEVFL